MLVTPQIFLKTSPMISDFEVVRKVFVAHWLSIFFVDVYQNSTIDFRNAFFALMIHTVGEVFFSFISCSAFDFHCLTSVAVDFQWEDEKLTTTVDFIIAFCDLVIRRKSR